jgi:lysozyme
MISPFGVTIVKEFERFKARRYIDAAGHPTIGYGHLIRPDENFPGPISKQDAHALLMQDLHVAERAVERLVQPLPKHQHEALVSWTFNLGEGNLERSTLRDTINGDSTHIWAVAQQMIRWVHAGGVRLGGLVRRRHCEAVWYMGAPDEIVLALARKVWR